MCRIHTFGLKSSHVRGVLEYITYILWSQPSIYVFGLVFSWTWYIRSQHDKRLQVQILLTPHLKCNILLQVPEDLVLHPHF